MRLTDEQRVAVEASGVSVALRSGAGCGKTTVLAERYRLAVAAAGGIAEVAALTFTEKAARQLRGRIREVCRRERRESPGEATRWTQILRTLGAASIGTIHSFCQSVLTSSPIEAGIAPGSAVVDEVIAASLRDQAVSAGFCQRLDAGDPDLIPICVEFGMERAREYLAGLMAAGTERELQAWAQADESAVIEAWRSHWESRGRRLLLERFVDQAAPLLELLRASETRHPTMAARRQALLEGIPAVLDAPEVCTHLRELQEQARVQGGGDASHWNPPEAYQAVKKGMERLRERISKTLTSLTADPTDTQTVARLAVRLARVARALRFEYESRKRQAGLLDFDDLLVLTERWLRREPSRPSIPWLDALRTVLVDEFQDTDDTQGRILEALAGETLDRGRLFLVGDSKQSIYRFRGANPTIFDEFRGRFPESGRLDLSRNFRSRPAILAFVNGLFDRALGDDPPLIGDDPRADRPEPAVTFLWASASASTSTSANASASASDGDGDGGGGDDGEAAEDASSGERLREIEAAWLARLVSRRLRQGWTVTDRRDRSCRPAVPGDVVFLFRTLNDAAPYERALQEVGLDYLIVGGAGFFALPEIRDVVNLLRCLDDPTDELALAASLRSPFFGLSDAGLYRLVLAGRARPIGGQLVAGFFEAVEPPGLSATDRERLNRARVLLGRWASAKDAIPMARLIDRILDESGVDAALATDRLGHRKRANLRKLAEIAGRFDRQGGWSFADLVARLKADLRRPPREDQAASTDHPGHAIRLMTIHQAKGLEFPIVVLPDLNRAHVGSKWPVAFDRALGVVVKTPDDSDADPDPERSPRPNLGWSTYEQSEAFEEDREARRLFYVGVTRAESELVLSAGLNLRKGPPKSPALRLLASRFDLATGTPRTPEAAVHRPRVEVVLTPPPAPDEPETARPPVDSRSWIERLRATDPPPSRRAPSPWTESLIHLDLDLDSHLPPSGRRRLALIRATLPTALLDQRLDPAILLDDAAARLGVPLSNPARQRLAELLRRCLDGRSSPSARPTRSELAIDWSLAWPPGPSPRAILRGTTDLLTRRRSGDWDLTLIHDSDAPPRQVRLHLQASAQAAAARGFEPVVAVHALSVGEETAASATEILIGTKPLTDALDAYLASETTGESGSA